VHGEPESTSAADVEQVEVVTYDPFAERRAMAVKLGEVIYLVFGLIDAVIALRFALRALGANPNVPFAQLVDTLSAPFMAPFARLFNPLEIQTGVLELDAIVAVLVYALLGWALARLIRLILSDPRWARRSVTTAVDTRVVH
jgi:uncharacterized protein YggT (Ycf19 family)